VIGGVVGRTVNLMSMSFAVLAGYNAAQTIIVAESAVSATVNANVARDGLCSRSTARVPCGNNSRRPGVRDGSETEIGQITFHRLPTFSNGGAGEDQSFFLNFH